mgnify:FL=1|tara:strand:- start:4 stop:456 length:453 start_codon:yes stop_codon:yes gene_type:complete
MRSDYLNENIMSNSGHKKKVKVLSTASTLAESDSGSIFLLNSTAEFATTLPAVATAGAGWYCKIVVEAAPSGASYTVIEGEGSDANVIIVNGINELEVDTSDDGVSSTGCSTITFADGVAIKGDFIDIWCDGSNYYVSGQTKADGGISVG